MPTIEIVTVKSNKLLSIENENLPFFVRQNSRLISHRGTFQKELDKINGVILHLGNKSMGRKGFFFGNELIDWDSKYNDFSIINDKDKKRILGEEKIFTFNKKIFDYLLKIIKKAIVCSPINQCYFLLIFKMEPNQEFK